MHSRLQISYTSPFVICIWLLLSWSCNAALMTAWPTTHCTTKYAMGGSIYCCNGNCADGTTVDTGTGLCKNWLSSCNDPPISAPICSQNQIFTVQGETSVTVGGNCDQSGTCQWSSFRYKYSCCDCPAGYISQVSSCAQLDKPGLFSYCVGCSLPSESLTYDLTTGGYTCQVSTTTAQICSAVAAVTAAVSIFGNTNSLLGALCPTTNLKDAAKVLLQLILSLADASSDPTKGLGLTGTGIGRAAGVIGTVGTFVAGLGFFAAGITTSPQIAAAVAAVYATGCLRSATAGLLATGLQAYLDLAKPFIDSHCPASTKRSIFDSTTSLDIENSYLNSLKRDVTFNPCEELVSLFPTDYTLAATLDATCNELSIFIASDIQEPNVAAAITEVQQFCADYQSSGNSTLLMNFEAVLQATNDFIPYCTTNQTIDVNLTSTASSSSSLVLQTTTSSVISTTSDVVVSVSTSNSAVSSGSTTSSPASLSSTMSGSTPSTKTRSTLTILTIPSSLSSSPSTSSPLPTSSSAKYSNSSATFPTSSTSPNPSNQPTTSSSLQTSNTVSVSLSGLGISASSPSIPCVGSSSAAVAATTSGAQHSGIMNPGNGRSGLPTLVYSQNTLPSSPPPLRYSQNGPPASASQASALTISSNAPGISGTSGQTPLATQTAISVSGLLGSDTATTSVISASSGSQFSDTGVGAAKSDAQTQAQSQSQVGSQTGSSPTTTSANTDSTTVSTGANSRPSTIVTSTASPRRVLVSRGTLRLIGMILASSVFILMDIYM